MFVRSFWLLPDPDTSLIKAFGKATENDIQSPYSLEEAINFLRIFSFHELPFPFFND
jgi:hypothetical protein